MNQTWPGPGQSGPVLLLDAAIGTRLIQQGLNLDVDLPALWVLTHPEIIAEIHRSDVQAGADAVLTATFGALRSALTRLGHGSDVAKLHADAVALARAAVGPDRFVIGSITPWGPDLSAVIEQAELLVIQGVDAIVFETVRARDALSLLQEIRPRMSLPLIVSLFDPETNLRSAARKLADAGADAIGANCQGNLHRASLEMEQLAKGSGGLPLWIKPGGGLPGGVGIPPGAFASELAKWLTLGVRFVGGCCGTDATHVSALRTAIDASDQPTTSEILERATRFQDAARGTDG